METTSRKSLPKPEITDDADTNIINIVRNTFRAAMDLLDKFTGFDADETITGKWIFSKGLQLSAGIGIQLTNNTGSTRAIGDVVMLDTSADRKFKRPTAAGIETGQVYVVTESITNNTVGLVAKNGRVKVTVAGGTTRGQYLETQLNSYIAIGKTAFGKGSFAIAVSNPDGSSQVDADLISIGSPTWITGFVPTGTIDGSNQSFSLPAYQDIEVYRNGLYKLLTTDYTKPDNTHISFVVAPLTGDTVVVNYLPA